MLIYKITNKTNGNSYIGQTIRTIEERWTEHCKKTSDCSAIANAIQKYGKENFDIEIICSALSIEELNKKEQYFIKEFNTLKPNGYNLTTGGLNFERTLESNNKMSERQIGEKNHNFGKKASKETKLLMSEAHMGKKNHFFGKTHTIKTRTILREKRKKQACPRTGTKHTVESLKKMSDAHKGQVSANRKSILCIENNTVYPSLTNAGKILNIDPSQICAVLKGKKKHAKGFTFKYI